MIIGFSTLIEESQVLVKPGFVKPADLLERNP